MLRFLSISTFIFVLQSHLTFACDEVTQRSAIEQILSASSGQRLLEHEFPRTRDSERFGTFWTKEYFCHLGSLTSFGHKLLKERADINTERVTTPNGYAVKVSQNEFWEAIKNICNLRCYPLSERNYW